MCAATSEHTCRIARSTRTLSRSSVHARTKHFHGCAWRKTWSLERMVRFAASPVIVGFAEVNAPTATSPKSSKNGSAISALGETTGVGSVDGTGPVVVELRALPRALVDLPAGETRGESVLRMTDLQRSRSEVLTRAHSSTHHGVCD